MVRVFHASLTSNISVKAEKSICEWNRGITKKDVSEKMKSLKIGAGGLVDSTGVSSYSVFKFVQICFEDWLYKKAVTPIGQPDFE